MNLKKVSTVWIISMASLFTSCAKNNWHIPGISKIYNGDMQSNRNQLEISMDAPTVQLVKLKLKPILEIAKRDNAGELTADKEQLDELEREQQNFINSVRALSPQVQVLFRYKRVLNAVAIVAPYRVIEKIGQMTSVSSMSSSVHFKRPNAEELKMDPNLVAFKRLNGNSTVKFIGGNIAHELGYTGKNIKVGIIDTGIDYTHGMLGGPGNEGLYASLNPEVKNEYFPNQKVVGGYDFVGTKYNAGSTKIDELIPRPDENPLDEGGHGSHVSGSVAGIGDNVHTYSGVAPDATLYALKVFGKEGSTSDVVIIQALEYAAEHKLDVVNLSLGGEYGKPKIMYNEAVRNLTHGGTVVVASAGNAGDNPNIVGAPSTADEAISVAAGVDDLPQNIDFDAVEINLPNSEKVVTERVEANFTKSADEAKISGKLIYIGNAVDPVIDPVAEMVKGNIALVDRGHTSFENMMELAKKLGASGVVVINHEEGMPIVMGKDKNPDKFEFPAVMIKLEIGNKIKAALQNHGQVNFSFVSESRIPHLELIDQITRFSSRGPRSIDSLIKPEITGPGSEVISALMGGGQNAVMMSGTSMSGPHLAGVMALMKQKYHRLPVDYLKSMVLNTAKILTNKNGVVPVALQGAGRVQVDKALGANGILMPATLSLGEVSISQNKVVSKSLSIFNPTEKDLVYSTSALVRNQSVSVKMPSTIVVKSKTAQEFVVDFIIKRQSEDQANIEADGFVVFKPNDGSSELHAPFLAMLNKVSAAFAYDLTTLSTSKDDEVGADVSLKLGNKGKNSTDVLIFNLIGTDERKVVKSYEKNTKAPMCDIEAVGMRIVTKYDKATEADKKYLQFGIKLYDYQNDWLACDASVQFDLNHDGIADYELVGTRSGNVPGIPGNVFASLLLDAKTVRDQRAIFEVERLSKNASENYAKSLVDASMMYFYKHSSVAVVEVALENFEEVTDGKVGIKVSTSILDEEQGGDDFLGNHEKEWQTINLSDKAMTYNEIPEIISLASGEEKDVRFKKGLGDSALLILYPYNAPAINAVTKDEQSQIIRTKLISNLM